MAAKRAAPRSQIAGGFEASRLSRRLRGWNAERRTTNALLAAGGEQLRARARQLCRENPYASNACEAYAAAAVGAGIKPSSLIEDGALKKAVHKLWKQWTDEADADGLTDFYGLQALAARAMFEAGEVFVRFRPRRLTDGLTVPLQLQLYESEMLAYSKNEQAPNGNVIREGIEFDKRGQRVAYWFYKSHPGEVWPVVFDFSFSRVPADEVLHLYRPRRAGDIRGTPQITPAMVRLYLLDLYDDAELEPIPTTKVSIQIENGVLNLLPTRPRGSAPTYGTPEKRSLKAYTIPHIPHDDSVLTTDVQDMIAWANGLQQAQLETVIGYVNRKLIGIALSIYAAIMHLISPAIEDGRLPSATWALIGALVGVGVLAGLTAINWSEIESIWEGHSFARPAVYHPAVDGAPAGCRSTLRDG